MWKLLIILSVAVAVYAKKTPCQQHRERELGHDAIGRVIPKCDENGDYEALQCFEGSNFCQCWDKKGKHIAGPSSKLKYCDCPLDKHVSEDFDPTGVFVHVPSCQDDGKFTPKQCMGEGMGVCWCVDEMSGKEKTEPTKDEVNC